MCDNSIRDTAPALHSEGRTVRLAENGPLSEREQQILRLVATGVSNKEIAHQLVISTNTVKVHLRNIFAKIGVVSRTEATLYAIREGLVQVGEARPASELDAGEAVSLALSPSTATPPSPPASAWARLRGWRLAAAFAALALLFVAGAGAAVVALAPTPTPPAPSPTSAASPVALAPPSRWQTRAPMPTARAGLGAAAYDGRIYAVAGETAGGPTGALERYDPAADAWSTLTAKPVPVADVGAAVVGGRIYVPGGRLAGGAVTSTLEAYDPVRDVWEQRAPLPVALSAYALVAFEGKLYVFGGWDGARFLASVYEYDPGRDAWTARTAMPTARGFAGAAVAGNRVYVVGGYDGEKALAVNEEYTPSREGTGEAIWGARAAPPTGQARVCAASVADSVFVVADASSGEGLVLRYSATDDVWQSLAAPASERSDGIGLVALRGFLHTLGGRGRGEVESSQQSFQAIYEVVVPILR